MRSTASCGLAIGHATGIGESVREVSRVLAPGGTLLYSDFHPEAARAGLTRSFKDESDRTCTVPHCCYDTTLQREAATGAGLEIDALDEVRVGFELREPFPSERTSIVAGMGCPSSWWCAQGNPRYERRYVHQRHPVGT